MLKWLFVTESFNKSSLKGSSCLSLVSETAGPEHQGPASPDILGVWGSKQPLQGHVWGWREALGIVWELIPTAGVGRAGGRETRKAQAHPRFLLPTLIADYFSPQARGRGCRVLLS